MIGIDDKIEVGGVIGILTKILLNKVVAFILDMCDPAFCVGASPFLVFYSVINPSFVGGGNSNPEAFLGGNNMVCSPTHNHNITVFGGMDQQFFEIVEIANV